MSTPPRLLFLDHTADMSGGEIALLRTVAALGRPVDVVLAQPGPLVEALRTVGATVHVIPLDDRTRTLSRQSLAGSPLASARGALDLLRYVLVLRRVLRALAPDVVHANSLKSGVYGCLTSRLARVPAVWHLRDRLSHDYMPAAAVALVRLAMTLLPTVVVVNSATTAGTLPRRWQRRYVVVPDPLESSATPDSVALARVLAPSEHVVMVGRIAPWKGQLLFLEAMALLRSRRPGLQVTVVGAALFGEDDYTRQVHARAGRADLAGAVDLVGFSDQVATHLAGAAVLVHASIVPEPFGQVVVEAMDAGVPVVVPDEGGPADLVRHRVEGLQYRARDERSLADAVDELLSDPELRVACSRAGRQRARDFSPSAAAEVLEPLYADLAASGSGVRS